MGFMETSDWNKCPVFYNVVHAVGKECPNLRDDVKLVQYLLMAYYDVQSPAQRPKGEIAVTGFCGGATMMWIRKFQEDVYRQYPGEVLRDNRIDRIRDKQLQGSISRTYYTLAFLNAYVSQQNAEAFAKLPSVIPLENSLTVAPPSADVVKSWPAPEPTL